MIITKISPRTGKFNKLDINITAEQWSKYCTGQYPIQDCFPNLTPDEREYIKTGLYPGEWEDIFND